MMRHYPDLGSASDWLKPISNAAQLMSTVARDRLCSFLSRRFAGKPVVASWNVGCFLRLPLRERFETSQLFFFFFAAQTQNDTQLS